MQIRNRLSLSFTLISSLLLGLVMAAIYLLWADAGRADFYNELHERAEVAAGVYLEADEISPDALRRVKERFISSLPAEVIRFYDSTNSPQFIADSGQTWPSRLINRIRQHGYLQYHYGRRQVVGIRYDDNQGTFVIIAAAEDRQGQARRRTLLRIMAGLFTAQIVVQFMAGRWFAQRALQPVQRVNEQVQKITATDLHLRVNEGNGRDELGTLARNFNGLLARLEDAFELQRMFVANASHEMKTPLTALIGGLEVVLGKARSAGEYRAAIKSTLAEAENLQAIIQHFLLLAGAEYTGGAQSEGVRIDEILWELAEGAQRDGGKILQVEMDALPEDEQLLCVRGDKTSLLLALGNIVRNAFKFSGGKPVLARLSADSEALRISIEDKGIGISPGAMPHIFQPFYRGGEAKSYEGHGVGLYTASRIVASCGGRIEVSSVPGKGSTFNVIFNQKGAF